MGSEPKIIPLESFPGRFGGTMIQSQENCLSNNHRFYPRVMGRGLCWDRIIGRIRNSRVITGGFFVFDKGSELKFMQLYLLGGIFLIIMLYFIFYGKTALAMDTAGEKRAILVASFGTSYPETRKMTIEAVENRIRDKFPGFTVRRAFTSRIIIKKIQREENLIIDTPQEALEKLKAEGYTNIVVQPLHIIAGQEYEELKNVVDDYVVQNSLHKIILGKPVLYSNAETCGGSDYEAAVKALEKQLPRLREDEAVVLMGHGTHHTANNSYTLLQKKLDAGGMKVYIGTVEASPLLADVINRLRDQNIKRVILMPYLLVAGDHAQNDLAGDEDDSWKVQLQKAGYEVDIYMHGLGENPAYQDIYLQRIKAVLNK